LKAGFSSRWIRDTQVQAIGTLYAFPTIASYLAAANGTNPFAYTLFGQTLGNPSLHYNSLFNGFFAQDSWKPLRNLTIVYGLRYGLYKMPDANKNSPFPFSQHFNLDTNNVAPRLGLAYGLGKNERTVIRASTGIFYDPPQTDHYRRALLNNGSPVFFTLTAVPAFPMLRLFRTFCPPCPPDSTYRLGTSQRFHQILPRCIHSTRTFRSAVKSALVSSWLPRITKGTHLPVYRNINLVPSGFSLADGRPIFSSTARVYPGFANILSAESVGNSEYNGMNLSLRKRFAHGSSIQSGRGTSAGRPR
jgi:TonB dependent receptor